MIKFKDACDGCGKFDYCKGQEDGKVLCPACIESKEQENGTENPTP